MLQVQVEGLQIEITSSYTVNGQLNPRIILPQQDDSRSRIQALGTHQTPEGTHADTTNDLDSSTNSTSATESEMLITDVPQMKSVSSTSTESFMQLTISDRNNS